MEFQVLGTLEVLIAGERIAVSSAKLRHLLAALLVHANTVVSAERLADILWSDNQPANPAATLCTYVSRLRSALEPGLESGATPSTIVTQPPGYLLHLAPDQLDADRFAHLVVAGRLRTTEADPAAAAQALDDALALWRGSAYAEFADADFARTEALRLEELRRVAMEDRFEALLALGHHAEIVGALELLTEADSLRERPRGQLMLALYRCGRQAEALRVYESYRLHLAAELGIAPSPTLRGLEHDILEQSPELSWQPVARVAPSAESQDRHIGPSGGVTVTFLFTDIEASTRLWQEHPDAMFDALTRHDAIVRNAVQGHGGRIVKHTGDGAHAVFAFPRDAVEAAVELQLGLTTADLGAVGELRARVAVLTGTATERDGDYFGTAVNRAARLAGICHGRQVLASHATAQLIANDLPAGLELRDLGHHRLRDLTTPEQVFQVAHPDLPADFPPLLSLGPGSDIPIPSTSLHGRGRELEDLAALLATPGVVTLMGPGGVGKTRLAMEAASRAEHAFRDGAWFIDLLSASGDDVHAAVAAEFGLVRRGRSSIRSSILEWLGRREALLVLDNCEQVLGEIAPLVRDIVRTCPRTAVLTTSRQPLGFPDETVFVVEPLALPLPDAVDAFADSPAVRLFVDRASAARHGLHFGDPELAVVVEICRRLDGIPLAVELAASRARSMTLTDILANLHSGSSALAMPTPDHPRHRTLLSTIGWSYDLLPPECRELFPRLSVFVGSYTADAVRAVCFEGAEGGDVVIRLADLVDRSMIVADLESAETRYRMLATLRDFAADQLTADDVDMLRARHATYYAARAQAAERGLRTSDEQYWTTTIGADFGNLQAAHRWALENHDADLDGRLLSPLWNYGLQRLSVEYFRWVDESLEAIDFGDDPVVAELLGAAALGAWLRGDLRESLRSCHAAFDAERRTGSGITLPARIAIVVATAYAADGTPARESIVAEAPTRFLEVVEWSRAVDDPYWLVYSMVTGSLGMVMTGELERATGLARRALQAASSSDSPVSLAWARFALATALEPSDAESAEHLLDEAVRGARPVDGRLVLGLAMSLQATLRRRLGRAAEAVPLLLELLDHWDRLGNLPQLWHTVRESALCLHVLGSDDVAARLLAAVDFAELVMPPLPSDRAHLDAARDKLLERAADASPGSGAMATSLSRESAVELAARALAGVEARRAFPT